MRLLNFSRSNSSTRALAFFSLGLFFSSCTPKNSTPPTPAQALYAHGKAVYQSNCTVCHNVDPHQPGAVGPAIFGSAQDLIEARVLHAAYPAGYTPKRTTHAMAALPFLKEEIPALNAYLNDVK